MRTQEQEVFDELKLGISRLDIQLEATLLSETDFQNKILQRIAERISFWLDHDFEQLLRLMYQLDIDEKAFRQALAGTDPAGHIAKLILQREIQKAKTRILYRNNQL